MTPDQEHLLYAHEDGELPDLYEVQLSEAGVREERTNPLRAMLDDTSAVVRFDSLQILVAWADPIAIERTLALLRSDSDDLVGQSAHRLHGVDTTLDQLGHALAMAVTIHSCDDPRLDEIADLLLDAATTGVVESGLERFLSALRNRTLVPKLRSVIVEKRAAGDARGASNLLPALAALDSEAAEETIQLFTANGYAREFAMGVAKALERIGSPAALAELATLRDREDLPGASHVARAALDS